MFVNTPITLILNAFTLALAVSLMLIILWYDVKRPVNQVFSIFLVLVQMWNIGSLLEELLPIIGTADQPLIVSAITTVGLIGSSIALYGLITILASIQPRYFRAILTLYLVVPIYYVFWSSSQNIPSNSFGLVFITVFDTLSIFVLWRYRKKLRSMSLIIGILLFIAGQAVNFLNPSLGVSTISTTVSSIGSLIISFSFVQSEILIPLLERGTQLETMHEVNVAITSRTDPDTVLTEIAQRATQWLGADAAGIFLAQNNHHVLVAVHELPVSLISYQLPLNQGITGKAAQTKQSILLENYNRDWHGSHDLPIGSQILGSVIAVPLIYGDEVIGVLLVISSAQGITFRQEDANLLSLMASQAAVAIGNGRLFSEQKRLTDQLSQANERLRTLLVSIENPVIAVDNHLTLIFTNPSAQELFHLDTFHSRSSVTSAIPRRALPPNQREALRQMRKRGVFRYEIELEDKTYVCHIAPLSQRQGFVAVLNDVSELKELDRIKSEMVRMTSHDLKNPLQAAMANLELLKDDIELLSPKDGEEIHLSITNIDRQLAKMQRIITGILDLERERAVIALNEICRPDEIIDSAIAELSDIAEENHIFLRTHLDPHTKNFAGNKESFQRALINLIENGIKFNQPNGTVLVTSKNVGQSVLITVHDSGIGIPAELHHKIFDRFYRGHQSGAEHISGSGLGLSLVKTVVENHHGTIWLESLPQKGTTFYLRIPALED